MSDKIEKHGQKLLSIKEIAELTGMTRDGVLKKIKRLGIQPKVPAELSGAGEDKKPALYDLDEINRVESVIILEQQQSIITKHTQEAEMMREQNPQKLEIMMIEGLDDLAAKKDIAHLKVKLAIATKMNQILTDNLKDSIELTEQLNLSKQQIEQLTSENNELKEQNDELNANVQVAKQEVEYHKQQEESLKESLGIAKKWKTMQGYGHLMGTSAWFPKYTNGGKADFVQSDSWAQELAKYEGITPKLIMDYQLDRAWYSYPVEMLHKLFGPNRKTIAYWREFYAKQKETIE